jgi:hypothetical protein
LTLIKELVEQIYSLIVGLLDALLKFDGLIHCAPPTDKDDMSFLPAVSRIYALLQNEQAKYGISKIGVYPA